MKNLKNVRKYEFKNLKNVRKREFKNLKNVHYRYETQDLQRVVGLETNEGMLTENMVAQMLRASGHRLYFYSKSGSNAEDRMEIDFLIRKSKVNNRHNISPIEVKSGRNYTLSSLRKCMAKYAPYLSTSYVLHSGDIKQDESIIFLPLYMTPLL